MAVTEAAKAHLAKLANEASKPKPTPKAKAKAKAKATKKEG